MSRLTDRDYRHHSYCPQYLNKFGARQLTEKEHKLGQVEDIEQELGIELSVFAKAHKGIYYKNSFNEICYCEHPRFEFCQAPTDMKWHLFVYREEELKISRYGKTWALTKEELENR